jgi:hypothetical protein
MGHSEFDPAARERRPWNAGRMVGAKRALKPQQVWAIRFWLDRERRLRDRALFDLAIDSKLRGCDVVKIRIGDLVSGGRVRARATVVQQKTGRPVQFELLEPARTAIQTWLEHRGGSIDDYAFPSLNNRAKHLSTRQYARLVDEWVTSAGLRREDYGTHSLRRTKGSIIYKAPGNLRAVQILLGDTKIGRPHQDREYGSLSRHRRRRRAHARRAHRGIAPGPVLLSPYGGRPRPNTGIGRTTAGPRKRTLAPSGSGSFAPFPGQGPVIMEVKPHAPAVASSNAESPQRESAAVSAGR